MDRDTALELFEAIEAHRYGFGNDLAPIYNVRLDAGTDDGAEDCRSYRLFVRLEVSSAENIARVVEMASRRKLLAVLENGGIELS